MKPSNQSGQRRQGIALIVTLLALVLLTGLVLAFFTRTLAHRQVTFSNTSMVKAGLLAQTTARLIVGELRQEIADTSDPADGATYRPKPGAGALPGRSGVASPDDLGKTTLLKVSADGHPLRAGGSLAGSPVAIDTPGANGRKIPHARWFGDQGPLMGSQTALPTWLYVTRGNGVKNPAPADAKNSASGDYVTGRFAYTVYNAGALLDANVAGSPLGISGTAPLAVSRKDWQSGIDLRDLKAGGATVFSAAANNQFTLWRSGSAWQSGTGGEEARYLAWLNNSARNGFLNPAPDSRVFLSRADLLRARAAVLPKNAPELFSHYSLTVTGPSWGPGKNAADLDGYEGGLGTTAHRYADNAGKSGSVNRFIPGVTYASSGTVTHYRDDGTATTYTVRAGDAVARRRFSLAKLAWLNWDGPAGDTVFSAGANREKAIRDCFGLVWNNPKRRWAYQEFIPDGAAGGSGQNRVKTLQEVADEKREPNFFELLNAGILEGSVGQHPGDLKLSDGKPMARDFAVFSGNKSRHILQIGLNIIDQYSRHNFPTLLYAPVNTDTDYGEAAELYDVLAGNKNLPYLHRMYLNFYEDPLASTPDDINNQRLNYWLVPELWNVHRQTRDATQPGPAVFRVRAYGKVITAWAHASKTNFFTKNMGNYRPYAEINTPLDYADAADFRDLYFGDNTPALTATKDSIFFGNPRLLRKENVTAGKTGAFTTSGSNYRPDTLQSDFFASWWSAAERDFPCAGIYAGSVDYYRDSTDATWYPANSTTTTSRYINSYLKGGDNGGVTLAVECWDGAGWRPYSMMARFETSFRINVRYWESKGTNDPAKNDAMPRTFDDLAFDHGADPRTDRFSVTQNNSYASVAFEKSFIENLNQLKPTAANSAKITPQESVLPDNTLKTTNVPTTFRYINASGTAPAINDSKDNSAKFWNTVFNNPAQLYPGNSAFAAYYTDPDGVTRPADAFRSNATATGAGTGDGLFLLHYTADPASRDRRRPVILSRPFTSVADLGYAYRDLPGRTLDFWSVKSADAALLDLFSLNDEPPLAAGKLNLGAMDESTLAALLKDSEVDVSGTVRLTQHQADTVAAALAARLRDESQPAVANPTDLVLQLADVINSALPGAKATDSPVPFRANKTWAEAPVRALASSVNSRVWNLTIDVVAQTGKLAGAAEGLQDFIVEGEQRCWVHVAIDRHTGKVLFQQTEPVTTE